MNLVSIKEMTRTGETSRALKEINVILQEKNERYIEALRVRAYIYNLKKKYPIALEDRMEILESQESKLKDYYLSANAALYTKDYCLVRKLLNKLLEESSIEHITWFNSAAYFLLAYCYMQENNYKNANINLDMAESIEKEVSVPIPLIIKMHNVKTLRAEIRKNQK